MTSRNCGCFSHGFPAQTMLRSQAFFFESTTRGRSKHNSVPENCFFFQNSQKHNLSEYRPGHLQICHSTIIVSSEAQIARQEDQEGAEEQKAEQIEQNLDGLPVGITWCHLVSPWSKNCGWTSTTTAKKKPDWLVMLRHVRFEKKMPKTTEIRKTWGVVPLPNHQKHIFFACQPSNYWYEARIVAANPKKIQEYHAKKSG